MQVLRYGLGLGAGRSMLEPNWEMSTYSNMKETMEKKPI